ALDEFLDDHVGLPQADLRPAGHGVVHLRDQDRVVTLGGLMRRHLEPCQRPVVSDRLATLDLLRRGGGGRRAGAGPPATRGQREGGRGENGQGQGSASYEYLSVEGGPTVQCQRSIQPG